MKILKYRKKRGNIYELELDKGCYELFDDIIIKYELLLKKEIDESWFNNVLKENNLFKAYYEALKLIDIKMRSEKELRTLLNKKYIDKEMEYALDRLKEEGYLRRDIYIDAYIHDALNLKVMGEIKIRHELEELGFQGKEIDKYLDKVDREIYREKIRKYIEKKLKGNKSSEKEFKRKVLNELVNKGFLNEDINLILDKVKISDNEEEITKIVQKLYKKYIKKYDLSMTKYKIKAYLYSKGYSDIDIDLYINN